MASLTVRQLDDKLKKLLRLRAARHGRSMEDEVRVILRQAAEEAGHEILEQFEPPRRTNSAFSSSSAAASPPINRST
jgi:phosphopantothenoylcysteine decarboxylase/phosphopantothenate--cysteine ligase